MLSPKAKAFGVEALLKTSSEQVKSNEGICDESKSKFLIHESKDTDLQIFNHKDHKIEKNVNPFPTTSSNFNIDVTQEHRINYIGHFYTNNGNVCLKRLHDEQRDTTDQSSFWSPNCKKIRLSESSGQEMKSDHMDHRKTSHNREIENKIFLKNKFQIDDNYKIYSCIDARFIKDNTANRSSSSSTQRLSNNNSVFTSEVSKDINQLIINEKCTPKIFTRTISEQLQQRPNINREINVTLQHRSLWGEFHQHQTEMIVTKNGRRMFPVIKIKVQGLKPDTPYMIYMDIIPVDGKRYRYAYLSSTWVVAGTGEAHSHHDRSVYVHPESPTTGKKWMDMQNISFDKLKLTNNRTWNAKGQIYLQSMQKYLPRIWIQSLENKLENDKNMSQDPNLLQKMIDRSQSLCFSFPETTFITVTAYQNQKITRLKINTNPFAKGFRDNTKYKNTTVEGQLTGSIHCGMMYQRSPHYPLNILPSISTSFLPPSLPFNPTIPFPSSYHLRPSLIPNRWSFYPSVRPTNEAFQTINSLLNRSTYHWEGSDGLVDLTKKKEKI